MSSSPKVSSVEVVGDGMTSSEGANQLVVVRPSSPHVVPVTPASPLHKRGFWSTTTLGACFADCCYFGHATLCCCCDTYEQRREIMALSNETEYVPFLSQMNAWAMGIDCSCWHRPWPESYLCWEVICFLPCAVAANRQRIIELNGDLAQSRVDSCLFYSCCAFAVFNHFCPCCVGCDFLNCARFHSPYAGNAHYCLCFVLPCMITQNHVQLKTTPRAPLQPLKQEMIMA